MKAPKQVYPSPGLRVNWLPDFTDHKEECATVEAVIKAGAKESIYQAGRWAPIITLGGFQIWSGDGHFKWSVQDTEKAATDTAFSRITSTLTVMFSEYDGFADKDHSHYIS